MPTTFGELRDQLEEALRAGRLLRSVVANTGRGREISNGEDLTISTRFPTS